MSTNMEEREHNGEYDSNTRGVSAATSLSNSPKVSGSNSVRKKGSKRDSAQSGRDEGVRAPPGRKGSKGGGR